MKKADINIPEKESKDKEEIEKLEDDYAGDDLTVNRECLNY